MNAGTRPGPDPAISVIMPVYNAGDTLRRAVEAIRHQMGPPLELICVDDASTDDSPRKLESWCADDPCIRLIRLESNQGPGAARNAGLEAARGEYVLFADADDTVLRGALARLHRLAVQHDSDIVKGTYEIVHDDGARDLVTGAVTFGPEVETTCLRQSPYLQSIPVSHCTYLHRRCLLVDRDIRYPTDLEIGEDLVFVARALVAARRVTLSPQVVFRYHQTPVSLTRWETPEPDRLLSAIEQKRRIAMLLREQGLKEASDRYLKTWDYQARTYWAPMSRQCSPEACTRIFDAFRAALPPDGRPWLEQSPLPNRYLYALLCTRADQRAIEFLRSDELVRGFDTQEMRESATELVKAVGN
jgi:glycosyltransferase involved in cell wall biosynthesis